MLVMRRSSSLRWLQFTVKIDLFGEAYATPIVSQAVPVRLPDWPFHCLKSLFIKSLSSTFAVVRACQIDQNVFMSYFYFSRKR